MRKEKIILVLIFALIALILAGIVLAYSAQAESYAVPAPEELFPPIEEADPVLPVTWEYLLTNAGAMAVTVLIAQLFKFPLDKIWKIPTRVFVYFIALVLMILACAFTDGLTLNRVALAAVNALAVALEAYGAYEVTFGKIDK